MGKSQKKRAMRRHNPMRVPDSHLPKGLEGANATSSKADAILPIIHKMESPDVSERKWACVAVSNLIQNDPSTRRLLQGKNVVGALITRLSDSEEEVLIEAAGALRNLCIDGGYDICGEMYNKNILAPLKTFIPKISNTLTQFLSNPSTAPENARKVVYEFADNVITILWCLSETSHKALNALNTLNLSPFLLSFLASKDKLPLSTVVSAAQCLYVLTEDNAPVVEEVRREGAWSACLLGIVRENGKGKEGDERGATLRVLCSGILRNISPVPPPSIASTIDIDREVVLPTLEPVIGGINLAEATQQAQAWIAQDEATPQLEKLTLSPNSKKHNAKSTSHNNYKEKTLSDHKTPSELELERLERKLRTVQVGLEILTGMCATLPEFDEPERTANDAQNEGENDDGMDDEEPQEDEDELMAEDSMLTDDSKQTAVSSIPTLVEPLLQLAHPTPLSFPPPSTGVSSHPPTTSALSAIHICALECLNNVFLALAQAQARSSVRRGDIEVGRRVYSEVWGVLEAVGTQAVGGPGQERRREMWGVGVGVLWGVTGVWKGGIVPQEGHIKVLIDLYEAAADEGLKVKCIGVLECLGQHAESVEANKLISTFLLSLLPGSPSPRTPPTALEPMLQATSALIDMFSDENTPYDVNFRQGGYLGMLAGSVEGVRRAVRGVDRKKAGMREVRRRGEEVRDNLVAFVEYRKALGL